MSEMNKRAICTSCGMPMTLDMMRYDMVCINVACPSNNQPDDGIAEVIASAPQPERSFTADLGPVRLPTREELLADARRGFWKPVYDGIPMDRVTILTRPGSNGHWLLNRHDPATPWASPYIHGLPATHWAEDTLGQPVV